MLASRPLRVLATAVAIAVCAACASGEPPPVTASASATTPAPSMTTIGTDRPAPSTTASGAPFDDPDVGLTVPRTSSKEGIDLVEPADEGLRGYALLVRS